RRFRDRAGQRGSSACSPTFGDGSGVNFDVRVRVLQRVPLRGGASAEVVAGLRRVGLDAAPLGEDVVVPAPRVAAEDTDAVRVFRVTEDQVGARGAGRV